MKKGLRLMCLLFTLITLFTLSYDSIAFAEASDKSAEAFERMSDEYMNKVLNEYKVAGVTLSVVKDGKIFFKKGYGYADIEKKIPVDPDTTAFHICSVSKLFTATAAMQLVDQGKLSLDEDINKYLTGFKLKNSFKRPVTLEMLLTHTAGFDETTPLYLKSTGDKFYESIEPLEQYIKKDMPEVIREPGTYCQYSVYGMALVGYLVQKVSGMPIEKYVTENILKPLDMNNSSYWLDKNIIGNMAKPYTYRKGKYTEGAYRLLSDHPSGSICATASDMANFIIMQLSNGKYGEINILEETAAKNMQQHHYPDDERLPGFGLGFYETVRNGYRTIDHGGYLPSFSSRLTMLPEQNIGMFISINTDSKQSGSVCNDFTDKFYEFFTAKKESRAAAAVFDAGTPLDIDADKISGSYIYDGYGHKDLSKLKSVLVTCKVQCNDAGDLTFSDGSMNWNFKYVGGGYFYCKDRSTYCKVSLRDNKMIFSVLGMDMEKASDTDTALFKAAIAGIPVFLTAIIVLIVSIIRSRSSGDREALIVRSALLSAYISIIAYFVFNGVMAVKCSSADTYIVFKFIIPLIKAACYLSLLSTMVSGIFIIRAWINGRYLLRSRVLYSITAIFAIINLIFMYVMNGFIL